MLVVLGVVPGNVTLDGALVAAVGGRSSEEALPGSGVGVGATSALQLLALQGMPVVVNIPAPMLRVVQARRCG